MRLRICVAAYGLVGVGCSPPESKSTSTSEEVADTGSCLVDMVTAYADSDGDGWGDASLRIESCGVPEGYVVEHGDCNDSDDAVFPGAEERCDAHDNDCDGSIDVDAVDATVWAEDRDGDGYSGSTTYVVACESPGSGWVEEGTLEDGDCDDGDSGVHPGAVEICGNGTDEDCDSDISVCLRTGAVTASDGYQLVGIQDHGQAGSHAAFVGDVNGDDVEDLVVGAIDAGVVTTGPSSGQVFLVSGPVTSGSSLSDATATIAHVGGSGNFGQLVASAGDWNLDGYADILVSDPHRDVDSDGSRFGTMYVFMGPLAGSLTTSAAEVVLTGTEDGRLGEQVRLGTDNAGDTILVVAEPTSRPGRVLVFQAGVEGVLDPDSARATWAGTVDGGRVGLGLSTQADTDGDGWSELVIGEVDAETDGDRMGAVYLVDPDAVGALNLSDAPDSLIGSEEDSSFGQQLEAVDLDCDGYDDVIVSAHGATNSSGVFEAGAVYLFPGSASGVGDQVGAVEGLDDRSHLGLWMQAISDEDGDGCSELMVSTPYEADRGAIYVIRAEFEGTAEVTDAAQLQILGVEAGGIFGHGISGGHDVTGDGVSDYLFGDSHVNAGGESRGAAWVLPGVGE